MKRVLLCAAMVLCAAWAVAGPASAGVEDFAIPLFETSYTLGRDTQNIAQLHVREKIVAEFPNHDQNHGILRAIPQTYQGHSLELAVQGVSDQNARPHPYTTYAQNDNLVLRIGDPDRYARGQHTYIIEYTMRGVILHFDDHEEFYWDVNGNQWPQPMGQVSASLRLPAAVAAQVYPKTVCYTGAHGSVQQNCTVTAAQDGSETVITVRTTQPLAAQQTLTMVTGFQKGTFMPYQPSVQRRVYQALTMAAVIGPSVLAFVIMVHRWRRFGRDPRGRGVIVPQYLPPKQTSVLVSGMVKQESFTPMLVSAQIIDLAVRHYIKVYEIQKKKLFGPKNMYDLELTKDIADLRDEEKQVVTMLFGTVPGIGARISLEKLGKKLYKKVQTLGKKVSTQAKNDGYFAVEPSRARLPYVSIGILLVAAGFVGMIVTFATLGISGAGLVVLLMAFIMPARTRKGVELRDYLLGLRDYMQLAEAERLKVIQGPHGALVQKSNTKDAAQLVKLYEKLLPYAMLFGIEEDWAKQFAHLYQQPPEWYGSAGTFNAAHFAAAVYGFNAAATTSFAPPNSSSSSGFSGGGAGGGGGGGGGGGW